MYGDQKQNWVLSGKVKWLAVNFKWSATKMGGMIVAISILVYNEDMKYILSKSVSW